MNHYIPTLYRLNKKANKIFQIKRGMLSHIPLPETSSLICFSLLPTLPSALLPALHYAPSGIIQAIPNYIPLTVLPLKIFLESAISCWPPILQPTVPNPPSCLSALLYYNITYPLTDIFSYVYLLNYTVHTLRNRPIIWK